MLCELLGVMRLGVVAAVVCVSLTAAAVTAASTSPVTVRCQWKPWPPSFQTSLHDNRGIVECSLNPPVTKLNERVSGQILRLGLRAYARAVYGPRRGLDVASPDHCRSNPIGADCEGEFTSKGNPFPHCAQWFQIIMFPLSTERPKPKPGTRALLQLGLSGLCHDPGYVAGLVGP